MMKKISIIIPVYNESDSLIQNIKKIRAQMSGENYEIIIVDGGSSDNTFHIAQQDKDLLVIPADKGRAKQMNA